MFINGQAGSGKSTMLFYLFADYINYYFNLLENLDDEEPFRLVFLAYNERLVSEARDRTKEILELNDEYGGGEINGPKRSFLNGDGFSGLFSSFRDFLIERIVKESAPSKRREFEFSKYLSFQKFRKLLDGKPTGDEAPAFRLPLSDNEKVAAEKAWFVIRSLIKGYSSDAELTPKSFLEISKDDRQLVSEEEFKIIYDKHWSQWYKNFFIDHGFWDDQDLVRFVLEQCTNLPEFAVVFCDESQDFTRIEIELISKLNVFTSGKYNLDALNNLPNKQIPISFAGDPNQTISPTGFRWGSIKAAFYKKIGKNVLFESLKINYRSSPAIVRFNNLVQLFRKEYLDLDDASVQEPWRLDQDGLSPRYLIIDEEDNYDNHYISTENVKRVFSVATILIPHDGEVEAQNKFVLEDSFLKHCVSETMLLVRRKCHLEIYLQHFPQRGLSLKVLYCSSLANILKI